MKQVLQNLSTGAVDLIDTPTPRLRAGTVLIDTSCSLISAGTERMLVQFGRASLINKARAQPKRVVDVLNKMKTDGVLATVDAVRSKLAQPMALGYSNVGVVREVGADVPGIAAGDRVVSNCPHAETVLAPRNLCVRIPDNVSDEAASFAIVGSIALQGVRLAEPTIGETFAVVGVGLIGLLTVQILRANGCRVIAIDIDDGRLSLAAEHGAITCNPGKGADPIAFATRQSASELGVDGVIITASTSSNDIIAQSAKMTRKRGRIILVGVTGLDLDRADFYEKELSFQVSCSYGPGRYDPAYEERGQDYPLPFVRWTEQRNIEAVLDLMASGAIDTGALVTRRFAIDDVADAYDALASDGSALGLLLTYDRPLAERTDGKVTNPAVTTAPAAVTIGCIGAGNFASRTLMPALKGREARLGTIVSSGGLSAAVEMRKSGFAHASSDVADILDDADINTVLVLTRHGSHAGLVERALRAGKHVFVEKPLAVTAEQLDQVEQAMRDAPGLVMVGFNRRFAPLAVKMKALLAPIDAPRAITITVNAGDLPANHWTQSPEEGGRIIGEACHFIDFARFLAGHPITGVSAHGLPAKARTDQSGDCAFITLRFADGSVASIQYLANGHQSFPKERIEVFAAGRILALDNFRELRGHGWKGFSRQKLLRQDKGHSAGIGSFVEAIKTGSPSPIPLEELLEVSRATIEAAGQLRARG